MGGMEQDQAAAAAAAPAAQGEVTELQRAAQGITNLLARAAIQSDALDERAQAVGQALEGATQCLMRHLESYDQNIGVAATAKTTNSPEGITKATRDGSRSKEGGGCHCSQCSSSQGIGLSELEVLVAASTLSEQV